jgi:hypothetical protein
MLTNAAFGWHKIFAEKLAVYKTANIFSFEVSFLVFMICILKAVTDYSPIAP